MVIVRAPIHNYRVGDTRSFICYLCLDANPLESLRLHLYFIRSSHVPLSGRLSLTINLDKSFPSTPLRLWTRSSPWTTSGSASRKHRITVMRDILQGSEGSSPLSPPPLPSLPLRPSLSILQVQRGRRVQPSLPLRKPFVSRELSSIFHAFPRPIPTSQPTRDPSAGLRPTDSHLQDGETDSNM